ncbi:nitroreductase family protein [Myroides odoratimimus]|uniref:nitroreductase family protein n=1 Tax=Myroides odoratimimus TaxID=76832 RepID=UPI0010405FFB|nr:nitroreductase family protein [Myroides odoratimimus]QBK77624.1 nitroreductase family protein [Myroides odoratimimus]WHT73071.1 nitroreductase family protein [Myroides odoratimimus]WHU37654.1 nitroreductase family protein [Myroides odoratimimus]
MKKVLKQLIRPIYWWGRIRILFLYNFYIDLRLYKKYSIVFGKKDLLQKEADLILNYHSLEKGMLFEDMKKGFAAYRISNLHKILKDHVVLKSIDRSQIRVGYEVMCKYYELHQDKGWDIDDIYTKEQYEFYKNILVGFYSNTFKGVYDFSKEEFYRNVKNSDFQEFAHSRKSVRDFTGEKIDSSIIEKVIELANTAPSVCNRQASNVYLVEDKQKIDSLLAIQGGFVGYTENVTQLLILTNDRKYYYTIGERNQLYIDGGIYLMNLLYALHYYEVGNCPANWGKEVSDDRKVLSIINIPESEKIICMIPIGKCKSNFRTTLSLRRGYSENFKKI